MALAYPMLTYLLPPSYRAVTMLIDYADRYIAQHRDQIPGHVLDAWRPMKRELLRWQSALSKEANGERSHSPA